MKQVHSAGHYCKQAFVLFTISFVLLMAGCGGGSDGATGAQGPAGPDGPEGPEGPPGQSVGTIEADELSFTVSGVVIESAPVVNFSVTNERGEGFSGIGESDLRFNLSKLLPALSGEPSRWQNYILRASSGGMQARQERNRSGYPWGTLENHGDGRYTYTFATDVSTVECPDPCTDFEGAPLDVSYQPMLTHRLSIQQGNRDIPLVNMVHDFLPVGGDVVDMREIIATENCNQCHDKITVHGTRFEAQLCVTCHNPGTWNGDNNYSADMSPMIHRIHAGANLPSVKAGGSLIIRGDDFSDVVYPQDIRNCSKCHDGSNPLTPQGHAWMQPSLSACGSCHDDIDFNVDGSVTEGGHTGGVVTDNSECMTCHDTDRIAGSVAESHTIPDKVARDYFQFNFLSICGTAVDMGPVCPPNTSPTLTFSVTDPSGAENHQYGNAYNVRADGTDPEFTTGGASFNMLVAWSTGDYTNHDGTGSRPSRTDSINLRTSTAVTDNADGTFTVNGAIEGVVVPVSASGSGAIALEGHPIGKDGEGNFSVRVPVNSEVSYFAITDTSPQPRRHVVDVPTKCDRCHDALNLHGNNRNNNGQLCVLCHNPAGTDIGRRPKDATTGLVDVTATVDGMAEQSVDFKYMIHAIHAGAKTTYDGEEGHGFREQGYVAYGYGGSAHDYSHVRFPGVLSKCETCHLDDTFTLDDRSDDGGADWLMPSFFGILGSTVNTHPNAAADGSDFVSRVADQTDDWKMSPTVSVCSACHDSSLAQQHMTDNNGIFGGEGSEPLVIANNIESCAVCHGPGKIADVKFVHDEAFDNFWGDVIPD